MNGNSTKNTSAERRGRGGGNLWRNEWIGTGARGRGSNYGHHDRKIHYSTGDYLSSGHEKCKSISFWTQNVQKYLKKKDGISLSKLFKFNNNIINNYEIQNISEATLISICNSNLSKVAHFKSLCMDYLKLKQFYLQPVPRYPEIIKQGIKFLDSWIDLYMDSKTNPHSHFVPLLAVICKILNKIRYEADKQEDMASGALDDNESNAENDTQSRYTKEVLNSIRGKLGRFRRDEERHGAYVLLLGESIKGCMQLRNMQMAAGFLKAIDSQKINYAKVLLGPMISFRYYLGKLYMQQELFEKAEKELIWAFSHSPSNNKRIRRNILQCLIAVRLRLGKVPPMTLLYKYDLPHYVDIVTATKSGNLELFDDAMEKYDKILIQHGTILCVERAKFIVYRNLMQYVKNWWINKSRLCGKPNIIPIPFFSAAVKWQSDSLFDENEMACISANLIVMGYIKGYISWDHMVIVFSQIDPFPALKNAKPTIL